MPKAIRDQAHALTPKERAAGAWWRSALGQRLKFSCRVDLFCTTSNNRRGMALTAFLCRAMGYPPKWAGAMAGVPQITGDLPQRRKSAAMGHKQSSGMPLRSARDCPDGGR